MPEVYDPATDAVDDIAETEHSDVDYYAKKKAELDYKVKCVSLQHELTRLKRDYAGMITRVGQELKQLQDTIAYLEPRAVGFDNLTKVLNLAANRDGGYINRSTLINQLEQKLKQLTTPVTNAPTNDGMGSEAVLGASIAGAGRPKGADE